MNFRHFLLSAGLAFLGASGATAQTSNADDRLIFLGADPVEGLNGSVTDDLSVLSLEGLPMADQAGVEVLAALLRSNPVSTFVTSPESASAQTGDIYFVTDIALIAGIDGPSVQLGPDTLSVAEMGGRLNALVSAFGPETRQIGFVRVKDSEDVFPTAIPDLRAAFDATGLSMTVLMVGPDAATCSGARTPFHYAVLAGVPDRSPFGDEDGVVTAAETVTYLEGALSRDATRATECSADYSLILHGDEAADRAVATVGAVPLISAMDQAVYMETFEALFLMASDDPAAIDGFLANCIYCPSEADLTSRARDIEGQAMALRMEAGVWESIREDTTPARFTVYLENCQLCAFRDEAQERLSFLSTAEAVRDEEARVLDDLLEADDLGGLIAWRSSCVGCVGLDVANARIDEIEADDRFKIEQASLDDALAAQNTYRIDEWLSNCELCSGKEEAEEALANLYVQADAAATCIAAAGLPQFGGPRLLTDIDQPAALATCSAILETYPDNPVVHTVLGRIAQAGGDMNTARTAYGRGMEAGLAEAFGLAAYDSYAPSDGSAADYARAEELALTGHASGDWLSGEVLTVLYSRELIDGRTASDAVNVALSHAEAGNPVAQFFAGFFFRTGTGIDASDIEAARWYQAAVDQNYAHASSFLAEIYEVGGEGIPADPVRAAELYFVGLDANDPTVFDRLTTQIGERPVEVVLEIQARLRDAGVFNALVDGISGPVTIRAIDAYAQQQRNQG